MNEEQQPQSWRAGSGKIHLEESCLGEAEKSSIAQPRLRCEGIVKQPPVLAPGAVRWHWGGLSVA